MAQMKALLEARAVKTCQTLLNDFEKRLLLHERGFQLFLVSYLFLSCVERMEWLLLSYVHDVGDSNEVWL